MKRLLNFSLVLLLIGMAACQTPEPEETTAPVQTPVRAVADTETDRQALVQIDAAYEQAMQAGNAAAIVALHADDAIVLPANQPALRGRSAIEAEFAKRYAQGAPVSLSTEEVFISESGDLGYIIGSSEEPDGSGKYLTVYRRTPEGWKIIADIWNMNQPPAESTASN